MTEKPIALVTGGAQGIGFACAEAIAADGAQIVLADVNNRGVKDAAEKLAGDTVAYVCDMWPYCLCLYYLQGVLL